MDKKLRGETYRGHARQKVKARTGSGLADRWADVVDLLGRRDTPIGIGVQAQGIVVRTRCPCSCSDKSLQT